MKVVAYCGKSFEAATEDMAGTKPLTSPPITHGNFEPYMVSGYDLVYFVFHGLPGETEWFEESTNPVTRQTTRTTAVRADQLSLAFFNGATVVAPCCHLGDDGNPMRKALFEAGAGYVIGGAGQNWFARNVLDGAGLLGLWIRRFLERGLSPDLAFDGAIAYLKVRRFGEIITYDRDSAEALADTLKFKLFTREDA